MEKLQRCTSMRIVPGSLKRFMCRCSGSGLRAQFPLGAWMPTQGAWRFLHQENGYSHCPIDLPKGRPYFSNRCWLRLFPVLRTLPPPSTTLLATLVCGFLLGGCSSSKAKKALPKPAVQGGGAKKDGADSSWQQSLGRVALVNPEMAFALVDIGTAPAPEPETPLRSYSGGTVSGELVVSKYQKRPFLILDITSGMPRVGDAIVGGFRSSSREKAQPSGGHAPSRGVTEDPLPRGDATVEYLPNLIKGEPKGADPVTRKAQTPASTLPSRPEVPSETIFISTPEPATSISRPETESRPVPEVSTPPLSPAPARPGDIIPGVPVSRTR